MSKHGKPSATDYKKTAGKPTVVTTAKGGKGLNSGSMNIFQMGAKPK